MVMWYLSAARSTARLLVAMVFSLAMGCGAFAQADTADKPAPSLAIGLNGVTDWTAQQPFINVFRTARTWSGKPKNGGEDWQIDRLRTEGHLDQNGWLKSIPPELDRIETYLLTDIPKEASASAGRYILRYKGTGKLEVIGNVSGVAYRKNEVSFKYRPGDGLVAVIIRTSDPDGTGDYVRDISIVKKEFLDLFEAGAIFNPNWIDLIEDVRVIRLMDWMETNGSTSAKWSDRPKPSQFTYSTGGVPLEILVALANEIGADPWFNMPHMASDEYVENFATYVRENLDEQRNIYVEYSNEVWNFIFPQSQWAVAQADARWGQDGDAWMQFTGMRAAQTAQIWDGVFGEAADSRVTNVISAQAGWPGLEENLLNAPLWVDEADGIEPPYKSFDAYAITGYFGHIVGSMDSADMVQGWLDESLKLAEAEADKLGLRRVSRREFLKEHRFNTAIPKAIEAMKNGSVAELRDEILPYHAKIARDHGLELVMYEGGTSLMGQEQLIDNETFADFFIAVNYSPEIGELYALTYDIWREGGGTLFNAFVDVAWPSRWGSWGALRHLSDQNARWDSLMAYNANGMDPNDTRTAADYANGVTLIGVKGPDRLKGTAHRDIITGGVGDDVLIGGGHDDRLHGGEGMDTAILPGAQADYVFAQDGDKLMAKGPRGVATLVSIEAISFATEPGVTVQTETLR